MRHYGRSVPFGTLASAAIAWAALTVPLRAQPASSDPSIAAQKEQAICEAAFIICANRCLAAPVTCDECNKARLKCRKEVYALVTPPGQPTGQTGPGTSPGGGTPKTTPNDPAQKKCSVAPLTEITDADAIAFEKGNQIDTDRLTEKMKTALACFRGKVKDAGGTFTLTSAYRPPAYQAHLKEIWNKWMALKNNSQEACKTIKQKVKAEFSKHGLLPSQEPAAISKHTQGLAIDAKVTLPKKVYRDVLADQCGLVRNVPKKDPVHYILK